jgi:hypothetical protein
VVNVARRENVQTASQSEWFYAVYVLIMAIDALDNMLINLSDVFLHEGMSYFCRQLFESRIELVG